MWLLGQNHASRLFTPDFPVEVVRSTNSRAAARFPNVPNHKMPFAKLSHINNMTPSTSQLDNQLAMLTIYLSFVLFFVATLFDLVSSSPLGDQPGLSTTPRSNRLSVSMTKSPRGKGTAAAAIARDRARITAMASRHDLSIPNIQERSETVTIINQDVDYAAQVVVGGQQVLLLVDTGSSSVWVCKMLPNSSGY